VKRRRFTCGRRTYSGEIRREMRARHPVRLLTNVSAEPGHDHGAWIADVYLTRWKCEEAYRFVKQSYHLEDVRVRSYIALRNIYALVHAIFYFVNVVIGANRSEDAPAQGQYRSTRLALPRAASLTRHGDTPPFLDLIIRAAAV